MDNIELSRYRLARAEETLIVAKELYTNKHYKDAINRSYYAAFFAMRVKHYWEILIKNIFLLENYPKNVAEGYTCWPLLGKPAITMTFLL